MKKLMLVGLILAVAGIANAGVTLTRVSGYYSGDGGEFTMKGLGSGVLAHYASVATVNGGVQSFCLERNEYVPVTNLPYTINDGAINGGVAGGNPDYLSDATKWLYYNFAKGTLATYDYNPAANRAVDAGTLQNTFWYLEEEHGLGNWDTRFLDAAATELGIDTKDGTDYSALRTTMTAGYLDVVKVMNPYDGATHKQSQLVIVPAPGALLLGTMGMGLVGWLRRRRTL